MIRLGHSDVGGDRDGTSDGGSGSDGHKDYVGRSKDSHTDGRGGGRNCVVIDRVVVEMN